MYWKVLLKIEKKTVVTASAHLVEPLKTKQNQTLT
jgi:hypothetical protein